MTTPMPTSGHCGGGHSNDHPRKDHPVSDHPGSAHQAVATLARKTREATKWTLTGGLIAAAAFLAGWVERGHSDGR